MGFAVDMDGVLWRGDEAIVTAVSAINELKARGKRVVFITNNSTKLPAEYRQKLAMIGLKDIRDVDVITSGTVTANHLKNRLARHPKRYRAFCVASEAVKTLLVEAGFKVVGTRDNEHMDADYVVVGEPILHMHEGRNMLDWDDLFAAVNAIKHGHAKYIATNPDPTDPLPNGLSKPVAGSIIGYISACVGTEPLILGKPFEGVYDDALEVLGLDKSQVLVIGDNLLTDIKGARDRGIDSLLVETGCHNRDDIKRLGIEPTHVLADMSGIHAL
jgi:4-nitrophenyl phosphatase